MTRILLLGFTLLFFIGCASTSIERKNVKNDQQAKIEAFSKLTATIHKIEKNYVRNIEIDEVVNKTIIGLFRELDESSFYIKGSEVFTYKYNKEIHPNKVLSSFESKYINDNILYLNVPLLKKGISLKIKDEIISNKNAKGIILDLRSNVGGVLNESIKIVDLFIDSGLIVLEKYKSEEKTHYANKNNTIYKGSLIILVDSLTASGAEIISGSLQSYNRAHIIGEKTFGNDSITVTLQINKDEFINLLVARIYLSNKKSIKNGITPNTIVKGSKLQLEEAIKLLN